MKKFKTKKMTGEEIINTLKELGIDGSNMQDQFYRGTVKDCFGEIEIVASQGDCEGGGEYAMNVFYFKKYDVYLQITGFYSSYHGTDWDKAIIEVKPQQRTVTVYESDFKQ